MLICASKSALLCSAAATPTFFRGWAWIVWTLLPCLSLLPLGPAAALPEARGPRFSRSTAAEEPPGETNTERTATGALTSPRPSRPTVSYFVCQATQNNIPKRENQLFQGCHRSKPRDNRTKVVSRSDLMDAEECEATTHLSTVQTRGFDRSHRFDQFSCRNKEGLEMAGTASPLE